MKYTYYRGPQLVALVITSSFDTDNSLDIYSKT